eukprot:jgi/Mesvir1/9665/Mv12150-RA.1
MSTPPGSQAITEQEERARRLFSSHQYAEAALAYAALARAEPTCGKWLTNEAKCHHHLNKVVTALNCCRKSMEVDPPWSRAYEIAAQCLLRVLRHNGAYEVLTQGMRLAPSPAIEKLLRETRVALYKDQVGMTGYDPEVAAQVAQGLVEVYDPQGRSAVLERAMWEVYEDTSDRARFAAAKAKNHRILRADTWRSWLRRARDLYEAGDWEEYLSFLEWCAEDDCPFAMTSLAVHHMRGDVAPADPASGVLWARRCIELGPDPACVAAGTTDEYLTDCQQALSTAYRHGIGGVEKDMDQAERWLRAAADAGDAVAMNNLARLLEELGRPPEEAVEWLLRSARAGCTVAARNLGKHYERGEGCPRDHEEAARWYGVAAEGGELDGVDCLVSLGLEQGSRLSTIMLGDARRHVKVLREREEGDGGASGAGGVARGGLGRGPVQDMGGGGATGRLARMLATEARLCLEIGLCRYADMSVGIRFHAKGRKAEAYERFLLPSAKLGDAQGCYVAGRHLAEVGTSAKELQAAQRFLSQAVASDVPGAQDELDALTARLARGGDLHGASPLNAGGDTFDGGSGGQGGSQVDGQHEEKAAAVTAAAIAVEAPGMQAIEGEVEVHCTQGSEDGAEDCAMGDGTGGSLAAAAATPGAAGGASSASGGVGAGAGTKTCWGCKARVASLRRCGGCRRAGYCSRECQKKHWKEGHREACAQLAA